MTSAKDDSAAVRDDRHGAVGAGAAAPHPASPRNTWRLVTDPQFGGVFWGKFFSFAGVTVHTLVISVLAYQATGSTTAVAVANTALYAPQFLLGPWSGAVSDRGWAVVQIVVGRATCGAGVAALALWLAFAEQSEGWAEVGVISVTAFVAGVGLAIGSAAMNSLVPQLVTRDEMPLAMTLNTAPLTVARVAGPVLGAWVLAAFGPVAALWVAAAGHFVFAAAVALARPDAGPKLPRTPQGSVRVAWRYVRREDRVLLRLLGGVALVGFASEPVFVLAPSYADELGGGTVEVGLLSASFGLGAALGMVLGGLAAGRVPQSRASVAGVALLAVAAAGCAAAPGFAAAHVAFAVCGVGFTVAMGALSTLVQLRVPPRLRGRVMALWILGLVGVRPFVSGLVGVVADAWSPRVAFAVVAVLAASGPVWLRPSRLEARTGEGHAVDDPSKNNA